MKVRSSYWQLLPYLWPQWPLLVKGSVCILGFVLFTLLLPYLAGQVAFLLVREMLTRLPTGSD